MVSKIFWVSLSKAALSEDAKMDFNRYFTNTELSEQLSQWSKELPELIVVTPFGQSRELRPIWLATVTDTNFGEADSKPAIWIDANLHATELAGTSAALCLIFRLLDGHRKGDQRIIHILQNFTFYIAPRLCPDGAERALAPIPNFVRSGVVPYPYPDTEEGMHVEDIDGDGRILQIRMRDPNGDWKQSALDPQLLEKRGPSEHGGEYYRLFPEGNLVDFDGTMIRVAKEKSYLDFNRNFPSRWRSEGQQVGAGPYPASEPEVRAVVDFISARRNINIALCFHTYGGLLLRPYDDRQDDYFETRDLWVYDLLGRMGTEVTGYAAGSTGKLLRYDPKEHITGTEDSWLFDDFGIFAWTVEIWNIATRAGIDQKLMIDWFRDHPHEQDKILLDWYRLNVPGGNGYVDWYPFQHPQLGAVELGGWNKLYVWRNPPHTFMGEEAERVSSFALLLAEVLPKITAKKLNVTSLGSDLYRLELFVENSGFLPTFTSEQAKKRGALRGVRVELEGNSSLQVISGKLKQEIGHLEGRSNKLSVSSFGYSASNTDNIGKAEWTVKGPARSEVSINISGERGGSFRVTCRLE